MNRARVALLFCCGIILWQPAFSAAQTPHVNEDSAIVEDFETRVAAYIKVRKAAAEGLPPLARGNRKGNILEHQRQLAERIRAARPTAKQGDICTPDIAAEIRRLIGLAMQGKNATRVRGSLRSAEPVTLGLIRVNAAFPEKMPLQSMPPTLLLNLPRLPDELDYRVVGRVLVLRDTAASIIVDFVPDALPGRS